MEEVKDHAPFLEFPNDMDKINYNRNFHYGKDMTSYACNHEAEKNPGFDKTMKGIMYK